jgi:HD superfamily phosphohydrolase YqeK
MIIDQYSYIIKPQRTDNLIHDLSELLVINNKLNTYKHVKEVAECSKVIAGKYGLDENTIELAAYAHDIAAIINSSDMLEYVIKENLYLDEAERKYPFLLHQRFGKMIVEDVFNITDTNVLSSIECHTTLWSKPSSYNMALFIADKLAWDQEGVPPYYEVVQKALEISLEKASLTYIDYIFEHEMILYPHSWLLEARKYLNEIL